MDANKGNIHLIFDGHRQFIIPIYQRAYSWGESQRERLWKDIVSMIKSNKQGHFIGSIVNVAEGELAAVGIHKFVLIDGQQRITTLILMLIALRDYSEKNVEDKSINAAMITEKFLKNNHQQGEEQYKLLLSQNDREILIKLIEKTSMDESQKKSKLIDTYNYFVEKINKKELTPKEIYDATGKLLIINITLERHSDDPQLIFESLNSTGMNLSQSDLIRNFILMGLKSEEQNNIYNNLWRPMEKLFNYDRQTESMDSFFRDFLTMKIARIPNIDKIYEEFKQFCQKDNKLEINEFCRELYKFASYYTDIVEIKCPDNEINQCFKDIKTLRMDVAYPFLLKVYDDYKNNIINKDNFIEILKLCESYVLRRAVCEIPTNSLNKTFATLKNSIDENDYINSLKAFFILQKDYKRYPTDEEFTEKLKMKNIYDMRISDYILSKFENHDNKAPINMKSYTIEHIMPQNPNLPNDWKTALGEDWKNIQEKYLHTIGNLTLTGYNSEMGDKPFQKKLDMEDGFKQSALKLNSYIVQQTEWNENKIIERACELCGKAKLIWQYPELIEAELEPYVNKAKTQGTPVYTLDDYTFSEYTADLYEALDNRILNLSPDVKRENKKLYIAYKSETNFIDVIPQKLRLRLVVNIKFNEVSDPKMICRDITHLGKWGNGDVEISFTDISQLDDIMDIIAQSYQKQKE